VIVAVSSYDSSVSSDDSVMAMSAVLGALGAGSTDWAGGSLARPTEGAAVVSLGAAPDATCVAGKARAPKIAVALMDLRQARVRPF
jgi:hypothetical protein